MHLLKTAKYLNQELVRNYLFDHKLLFLFGYFFYLLSPYIVGSIQFFEDFPGITLYQNYFQQIPSAKIQRYLFISLGWLPAFFGGHYLFKAIHPSGIKVSKFEATPVSRSTDYLSFPLLLVLLVFAYMARSSFLSDYTHYDVGPRGKLSTLLVIYNFFLVYQLISKQKLNVLLALGTIVTAALLLTMGGRMYVVQTFIIFLMYKTSFSNKPWNKSTIIFFLISGAFVASIVGIWRLNAGVSVEYVMYSIFAEPLFTWFSTSTFLINNEIPLINFPVNFLSSFINLIPNTFFNVRQFVIPAQAMGYTYESPLGADSAWTNIIINFGSLGSFVFLFITGFLLHYLKYLSSRKRFYGVYYLLVCSILPFQFFRDGFFILNKQLFFNFLFIPLLLLLSIEFLIFAQMKKSS